MNERVGFKKTWDSRELCTGLTFILCQNYWCHVTPTHREPDTSLRRTVGVGADGVRLSLEKVYCIPERWHMQFPYLTQRFTPFAINF